MMLDQYLSNRPPTSIPHVLSTQSAEELVHLPQASQALSTGLAGIESSPVTCNHLVASSISPSSASIIPQPPQQTCTMATPSQVLVSERLSHESSAALPDAYVWPLQERPTVQYDEFSEDEIPVIDLADLQGTEDNAAVERIIKRIRDACREWGFFQVINHGISIELLARVQRQALQFFSLPLEEKMKVLKPPGAFTGYGFAAVKETDNKPWQEGFYLANDPSIDDFSRKLWPEGNNDDFCNSYKEYDEAAKKLALQLMSVIIHGLGVDRAHFEQYLTKSSALLRWNHYPPCPEPEKTLGMTPHTDFNILTILHQGEIGGLQVEKDGKWIAVRPRNDALAINVGDSLQVMTNGRYKSVPHRAVVNRSKARISLAYFFLPAPSVEIVCSPDLLDEQNPPLYKPFTIEEYTIVKTTQLLHTLEHFTVAADT